MNKREPLFHISKRGAVPWYAAWAIRGCALVLALWLYKDEKGFEKQ